MTSKEVVVMIMVLEACAFMIGEGMMFFWPAEKYQELLQYLTFQIVAVLILFGYWWGLHYRKSGRKR